MYNATINGRGMGVIYTSFNRAPSTYTIAKMRLILTNQATPSSRMCFVVQRQCADLGRLCAGDGGTCLYAIEDSKAGKEACCPTGLVDVPPSG